MEIYNQHSLPHLHPGGEESEIFVVLCLYIIFFLVDMHNNNKRLHADYIDTFVTHIFTSSVTFQCFGSTHLSCVGGCVYMYT